MKTFYVTFFGNICGKVAADVPMDAKSLKALKKKIRDHERTLKDVDIVQVYNMTDDKLHEAHLKSLNFHKL